MMLYNNATVEVGAEQLTGGGKEPCKFGGGVPTPGKLDS